MGESEEYIPAQSAEQGLAPEQGEQPAEETPSGLPEQVEPADDPIAAIQQQLAMEDAGAAAETVADTVAADGTEVAHDTTPSDELPAELVAVPVEIEEPASSEEPQSDVTSEAAVDEALIEQPAEEMPPPEEAVVSDEDLSAAVAAASESVGDAEIVAPVAAPEIVAAEVTLPSARYGAPWWPFFIYLGLWAVVAGVGVWQLDLLPVEQVIYDSMTYRWLLFAGLVMAAMGPVLVLAVWLASRESEKRQRHGLFTSALFKGAFFTMLGVMIWWGTLLAVDFLRFGRLF